MGQTQSQDYDPSPGPPPGYHAQQQQRLNPSIYRITKPIMESHYECRPENAADTGSAAYSFAIDREAPHLTIHTGGPSGPTIGGCTFPKVTSNTKHPKTFDMSLGNVSTEISFNGSKNGGYTFTYTNPQTHKSIPLVWRRTSSLAVDGMSTSWLSDRNSRLQDPSGKDLAVFTADSMSFWPGARGGLQFFVDLGPAFERTVVLSVLAAYDFEGWEEDQEQRWRSAARNHNAAAEGGAAVAASLE